MTMSISLGPAPDRRTQLARRIRLLVAATITYNVIEAVVVVAGPGRTRAVAIRLEGFDSRWRASSLAIL